MNNKKTLLTFFVLTFILSWGLWTAHVLNANGVEMPVFLMIAGMFAIYGPMFAALIITGIQEGKKGIISLFKNLFKIKLSLITGLMIFALPLVLTLIPYLMIKPTTTYQSEFLANPTSIFLMFFSMIFIGGPLGEELGWRGFALPRLLKLTNPFNASLILGIIHGLWHLPLFLIPTTVQSHLPVWEFIAIITLTSFIYTWLYEKTGCSSASALLFHNMGNLAAWMFPYYQNTLGRYIFFALNLVVVLILILKSQKIFKEKKNFLF